MTSFADQVSRPRIAFLDTVTIPAAPFPSSILMDRPTRVRIDMQRRATTAEAMNGREETLFYFDRHVVTVDWNWLAIGTGGADGFSDLRRLWQSTQDGTPFTLWLHEAIEVGYPDPTDPTFWVHENKYSVRWDASMKEFHVEDASRVKDRFHASLKFREVRT